MSQQSKFLHHTACEHCGSSDAKALYDNGGAFCFSCKKLTRGTVSGYVAQTERASFEVMPPDDIGYEYSQDALEWAKQYDITAADLIRNKVFWSPRFQQLMYVYQFADRPGIGLIQGRNFIAGRPKYFNRGDVSLVLPIYKPKDCDSSNILVLVEDAMSAIKITRDLCVDAMPILGSSLALPKITKLASKGYETIIVWLDHDKYKEAMRISTQIRYTGPNSFVVTTDLDPKCYDSSMIAQRLKVTA